MVGRAGNSKDKEMKYEETHAVFNKIKKQTGLEDEALKLLDAGMSRKKAAEVIYKL